MTTIHEDVRFLLILMKRASKILDNESGLRPFREEKIQVQDKTYDYTVRNSDHTELKRLLKDIRRESIALEKRMERENK